MVRGFTVSVTPPQDHQWHGDPHCPELGRDSGAPGCPVVLAGVAATAVELALAQGAESSFPCRLCTAGMLLDELLATSIGRACYHYLVCGTWHARDKSCTLCAVLSAYGASRGIPVTTTKDRRGALLGRGFPEHKDTAALTSLMGLFYQSTPWSTDLGAVSAPVWDAAGGLLGTHDLLTALSAAAAVLAPVAPSLGPTSRSPGLRTSQPE